MFLIPNNENTIFFLVIQKLNNMSVNTFQYAPGSEDIYCSCKLAINFDDEQ